MGLLYGLLVGVIVTIIVLVVILIILLVWDANSKSEPMKQYRMPIVQNSVSPYQNKPVSAKADIEKKVEKKRWLVLSDVAHSERQFECEIKSAVTVGRSPGNQIVIDDDITVSGIHCQFSLAEGECWVKDMKSANGTYIDNRKITEFGPITNDIQIRIGGSTYSIKLI